jgi:NTP pyrophosphatase (non-canonical NTP hydrolase)
MNFNEYQNNITKFCKYPQKTELFHPKGYEVPTYPFFELAGEVGEVCEKVKKISRDKKGTMSYEDIDILKKELGDVLFALSRISTHLGINLEDVADSNVAKLQSRLDRDKIHGSGDNR